MLIERTGSIAIAVSVGLTLLSCSGNDHQSTPSSSGGSAFGAGGTQAVQSTISGTAVPGGQTHTGAGGVTGAQSSTRGTTTAINPTTKPDLNASPMPIVTVRLEIDPSAIDRLDTNPFHASDVMGAFTDGAGTRYDSIEVNYRGAYALQSLIENGATQRNWKLKFTAGTLYQNRREWNFNYEPHLRERLTYWLMRQADVKVPSARHVVLTVNGKVHGLHLEYEDPDNKHWLLDAFGNNDGDLYKAGYDFPDEPVYFATTEVLGVSDADYQRHYAKKTNNDEPASALNFSSLREFIRGLNETSDLEFEAFIRRSFDIDSFVGYLVVANFVSHWDSLPQRPKNYWLYQVPTSGKWIFIPWDMDATFWPWEGFLNNMGTDASIFHQFDGFLDYRGRQPEEGTARPLVTRIMKVPAFRSEYVARYRQALKSYLAKDYLLAQVATLNTMTVAAAQPEELEALEEARVDTVEFINQRTASVTSELQSLP